MPEDRGTMVIVAPHEDLPPLIQTLLTPAIHGGQVDKVELLQTHISWVLLAGDLAYKIKKPIKLLFLDFSTLALRKRFCEDELRLNRRFAPDIYLDVVAICESTDHGVRIVTGSSVVAESPVVEYAVRMKRFDTAGQLDVLCKQGALTSSQVSDLAARVAELHATAATAPPDSRFGTPTAVLAPMLENFVDLENLLPRADQLRHGLRTLRGWTEQQFALLTPLLEARKRSGFIRECHGDLHLANMVLIDERVQLFDCLEFNEDLRWIDVTSDLAFAYIDLLGHGRDGLANWFINEVLARSGDHACVPLLRFYAVYRTLVRAKVAAIRANQTGGHISIESREGGPSNGSGGGDRRQPHQWITQAQRLAVPPGSLRLTITHGLAASGKTIASTRLLQHDRSRSLRLRSDVERKRLFGLAPAQHSGSATGAGIYTPDAHVRTYAYLLETARQLLQAGWSVIVDAAFLHRVERDQFRDLAQACGAEFGILAPQASTDVLRQRIRARRAAGTDASEATLDVLDKQLQWIEPLDEDERLLTLPDPPTT